MDARIGSAARRLLVAWLAAWACLGPSPAAATGAVAGRVLDAGGAPVVGAMVTISDGAPSHRVTVFSDADGRYRTPPLDLSAGATLRVRRLGWTDWSGRLPSPGPHGDRSRDVSLQRVEGAAELAEQLPAHHWAALVLEQLPDPARRAEFKRECTGCHQQGSAYTHRVREEEEWRKLIALMGRRGAMLTKALREALPAAFNAAYDPAHAVPELTDGGEGREQLLAPPGPEVRRALIEEWDLGTRASTEHDIMVHPDGRLYAVDGPQDLLHRLDPTAPDGARRSWRIPDGGLPLGGIFASPSTPRTSTSNSHVGPHSLQTAPDGSIWITLAIGNRLARFDPASESWEIRELDGGIYPHTLRFDQRGRLWYTLAASNHVGMLDPATGESRTLRLPAGSWKQEIALRMMPFLLWLGRHVDLRGTASAQGDGFTMPVPYGIDVAPDGSVWFSQLNENRIGRIDPDDFDVEMIETPFPAPRRLRFDPDGGLWIPSFSGALIARFDVETREFRRWQLPGPASAGRTPYALAVEPRTGDVWICGTNSDSLIRFEPRSERFTVYPLPTRVTYSREIDFDPQGRIWTSNSNSPTWQIEDGVARVVRLTPGGMPRVAAGGGRP